MGSTLKIAPLALFALAALQPIHAVAWGNRGHQVIALLAARELSTNARSQVEAILGAPASSAMMAASTWADEIRPNRRETAPWHYVNIEAASAPYRAGRDCLSGDCVVEQIEKERRTITNPALSNTEKVEALRFLIHFIGDVHQPLHVFDNHDRGGNEVPVAMEMSGVEGDHSSNLHAVWDREMVDQLGSDATAISEKVSGELTPSKRHAWSSGSAASWANESFAIARDEIYRRLSIRGREKIVLDRAYLVKEAPVVVVQIERASIRLAWVLNAAFKKAALPPKMLRASATISASAAGQHVGTIAAIVDVVVNVHRTRGGTIFLDFGGRYPANVFSAVIMPAHSSEFSNIEALTGQKVRVSGLVQLYKGKPEVLLDRQSQLSTVRQ